MQELPHTFIPLLHRGGDVHVPVPEEQVRVPFAMAQSAFVQHWPEGMQRASHFLYPVLHAHGWHAPPRQVAVAFSGAEQVLPSGAFGYVVGQVPVVALHVTAR